jgi:hypothetical protein
MTCRLHFIFFHPFLLFVRYVVLVTLRERLGGAQLRWSQLNGVKWSGSTPFPVRHDGRFHDTDLSFAQKRNRVR